MAKLYKVEMYVIDTNDEYTSLEALINNQCEDPTNFNAFNAQVAEVDYKDDIDINEIGCPVENFRKYFETK